jgi:hypothetical protein
MSGLPTPRLGRAVRLFTPVVLAGTLTVPLFADANDFHGNKHRFPVPPAATTPATTPAAPAAAPAAPQETTTPATPAAPAAVDAAPVAEQPAAAADPAPQADSAAAVADDAQLAEAPGFAADSVHAGDDNDDNGNGNGNGHAYGHDKNVKPGKGHAYGRDDKKAHPMHPVHPMHPWHPEHPQHPVHPVHPEHPEHPKPHDDTPSSSPSSSPASAPAPTLAPISSPSLAAAANQVLKPRVCSSKRSVTIRLDRGYKVRAARVLLNGHLVKVTRHNKKVTSTINLRNRAKGTYTVRTLVVTKGNKIRIGTRKFTTCAAPKKH